MLSFALVMMYATGMVMGCSYVQVPYPGPEGKGTERLTARTMELGATLGTWEVSSYPRSVEPTGHGFVGIDLVIASGSPLQKVFPRITSEGLNEHGLTVSAHTLSGSVYQMPSATHNSSDMPRLSFLRVLSSLLRNAADVPEAIAYLQQTMVVNSPPFAQKLANGVHWGLSDAAGRSVVIEYIEGSMKVHNNTVGVLTNDPPFPWHLYNLNTHVNLRHDWPTSNEDIRVQTEVGMVPQAVGHGYNLAGLPGDSSPPARFTRLFYLRQYAQANHPSQSLEDAIVVGTGLVNNVFIIKGTVAGEGGLTGLEYVPYAVIKIPTRGVFMFRSYTDMQWRRVDLNQLDFSVGTSIISIGLPKGINALNVTRAFVPV